MDNIEYDLIFVPRGSDLFQVQFQHWNQGTDILKFLDLKTAGYKPQQNKLQINFSPSENFQNIDSEKNCITFESRKKNPKGHQLFCVPDHENKVIYAYSITSILEMHRKIETELQVKASEDSSLEDDFSDISKRKDFKRYLESKLRAHSFQKKILESEKYLPTSWTQKPIAKEEQEEIEEMNFLGPSEYIQNLTI